MKTRRSKRAPHTEPFPVRLTDDELKWLRDEATRLTEELSFRVTPSAVIRRLIRQAAKTNGSSTLRVK